MQLRKKDAHAENWILTGGKLMMIDLEASGYRPALFEVAQLIDDFGVIPVDDAGFKMRLRLAREYLQYLTTFGLPIEPPRLHLPQCIQHFGCCAVLSVSACSGADRKCALPHLYERYPIATSIIGSH